MKAPVFSAALIIACLTARAFAADDPDNKPNPSQEAPKDAAADDAKGKDAKPAPPAPAPAAATDSTDKNGKPVATAPTPAPAPKDPAAKDNAANAPKAPAQPPTVLPQVEVRRNRLIEIDRQIMDLEDDIAREKKKTKATESDKALNDSRVSSAATVFGGSSAESRAELAAQRISLMEAELSLLEMSAASKTKAEKDDLQKQALELRTMRRDLDRGAK